MKIDNNSVWHSRAQGDAARRTEDTLQRYSAYRWAVLDIFRGIPAQVETQEESWSRCKADR